MAAEPFYVNGTGGLTTEVMLAAPRTVRLKNGAEGVFTAALPTMGLGVALKIDDGAMRAAECAIVHILRELGCFDASQEAGLRLSLILRLRPTPAAMRAQSGLRLR